MSSIPKINMVGFVCVSIYVVLSLGTAPVAGQCMASSCVFSSSGFEECPGDLDHMFETMNHNIGSALEKLEAAVTRANVRGQEKLCQDTKDLCYNLSVNLERVGEKIPVRAECPAMQGQEEYLNSMNLNLTSMIARTDERIQNLRSTFQNEIRNLNYKFLTLNETVSSAIDKISGRLDAILDYLKYSNQSVEPEDHCQNTSIACDCSDIKANGFTADGVYRIYVFDRGQRYYADTFCDMTTTDGALTVFQRRKDGSVDFYRNWKNYSDGFGNASEEFWLGNEILNQITSNRKYKLRIDLEDFENQKRYAEYSSFSIGPSSDYYRLKIGTYSGNAGDSLSYHNNQQFSTPDVDRDQHPSLNCAANYCQGSWWFSNCHYSNLNGRYWRGVYSGNPTGVVWHHWRGYYYSLKATEMKIARLQ